jgi:hypothetical protein
MAKKIVQLKSKRKVELKEMSIDDIDACNDMTIIKQDVNGETYVSGISKARTAWIRKGIAGGDFKSFSNKNGVVADSCIKELTEEEKNEIVTLIQEYQNLGE